MWFSIQTQTTCEYLFVGAAGSAGAPDEAVVSANVVVVSRVVVVGGAAFFDDPAPQLASKAPPTSTTATADAARPRTLRGRAILRRITMASVIAATARASCSALA
ncbi:MAG: hypothetical protein JOZ04_07570, partial [Acidimicrobiia bacterium]|nr:hypothetical protein [Acidimicrobiia bacterium]